jgi:hypothetical protein
MKAVAERLEALGLDYAFLGGSVVGLLLDHPELSPVPGDYYASHDLEDLITVIDGREKIVDEIAAADPALCNFVSKAMAALVAAEDFMEALPGHLPADAASQGRLAGLRRKLTEIAASR